MLKINTEAIENLKAHKYNTAGYSILDNKMNPFWIKCQLLVPHFISANGLTLLGLLFAGLSFAIYLPYDPTWCFCGSIPIFVPIISSFFLFLYQTLDAIDGKHARATDTCSPLGQLYDHGVDSLAAVFIALSIGEAVCFKQSYSLITVFIMINVVFFMFQVEEKYTHILRTNIGGVLGTTETQFLIMFLMIVCVILGCNPLSMQIQLGGFKIATNDFILLLAFLAHIASWIGSIVICCRKASSILNVFADIFPILILTITAYCWLSTVVFYKYSVLCLLSVGFIYSRISCTIILSTMTKQTFPKFFIQIYLTLFVVFYLNYDLFGKPLFLGHRPIISEDLIFLIYFAVITLDYCYFMFSTALKLSKGLNCYLVWPGKPPNPEVEGVKKDQKK